MNKVIEIMYSCSICGTFFVKKVDSEAKAFTTEEYICNCGCNLIMERKFIKENDYKIKEN